MELIGRRWSGAILREMLLGANRFGQIREAIPQLTDKMLASRLRELEAEGILTRTVFPEIPVRVEYQRTDKGRDLEAAVYSLTQWADRWAGADEDAAAERSSTA